MRAYRIIYDDLSDVIHARNAKRAVKNFIEKYDIENPDFELLDCERITEEQFNDEYLW